jgi:hypothetical protein
MPINAQARCSPVKLLWPAVALALVMSCAAAAAAAAGSQPGNAATEATYQRERAACLNGQSHQARSSCLAEAGAARNEARGGRLGQGQSQEVLVYNAGLRCDSVAPADREACDSRVRGQGQMSGSVEAGGILKSTVTRTQEPLAGVAPGTGTPASGSGP